MGLDIKATLDQIVAFVSQNYLLVFAGLVLLVLFSSKGIFARVRHGIEKALTDNWQLTLLASTGVALSLASGYTTFDGLRNFTSAPLLSVLISFGIQGVMLIVAWLIGESFAVGMHQRAADGRRLRLVDATVGMALGVAFVGLVFYWVLHQYDAVTVTNTGFRADMVRFVDVSVYFVMALVLVALVAFGSRRGGEIATPYAQSLRLVLKNAVLWVMFLASMSASVFFSFDSHFNAIFPADARKRAAEIRTTNQIGAAVADIGALTQKRQLEESESLFNADGWKAYEKQLVTLAQAAQGAQAEIEQYFVQKLEERRRAINQQQERIATSQSGQAGMAVKKISLTEELSRLKADRPGLAAEYAQHKSELDAKAREIDGKRVEGMAEDRGVEGTLKQGKGPVYRQRIAELATLQDQYKIKQERTKDAQKRLIAAETRIAQIERELSVLDGDLAKLKGEAETAEQRIKTAQSASADDDGAKVDPARVLPAFERARAAFRQQPDVERLAGLQQQCANLVNAMSSTPATKEKTRGVDCDPKQAADAAARVFALNAGLVAFQSSCASGEKVAQHTTTDGLLAFGRRCLQDSGLISKDSALVGARLSAIDMNRDDKAHRFVVTWNAFLDGNRLAYLALILAIGVDALVFMSGLFGAQALRSPLSDVPSPKARSAEQLQAVIDTALLPHTYESARLMLSAMRPMERPCDGFTQRVFVRDSDPHAPDLHRVLNAGATIGAVRQSDTDTYELRAELFEYLSLVAKKAFIADARHVTSAELEQIVVVALLPRVEENVETVLRYVQPIEDRPTFLQKVGLSERHDFTAEISLAAISTADDRKVVRSALNAGATLDAVQRANNDHYFLTRDFYKVLARIRARFLASSSRETLHAALPLTERKLLQDAGAPQLQHLPQRASPSEDQLGDRIWDELLDAIGLTRAGISRLRHKAVREQATEAWDSLGRIAQSNFRLDSFLKDAAQTKREAIDEKYSELREKFDGDGRRVEILDRVTEDLDHVFKPLLLLPEVGLLPELIKRLEDAAQYDGGHVPGEEQLLSLLRTVDEEIERIDKSRPEGWKRVVQIIQGRRDDNQSQGLREIDPANKQPI